MPMAVGLQANSGKMTSPTFEGSLGNGEIARNAKFVSLIKASRCGAFAALFDKLTFGTYSVGG